MSGHRSFAPISALELFSCTKVKIKLVLSGAVLTQILVNFVAVTSHVTLFAYVITINLTTFELVTLPKF